METTAELLTLTETNRTHQDFTHTPDVTETYVSNDLVGGASAAWDAVFYVISTLGIVGNAFILYVFLFYRDLLKSRTHRFLCNQSRIDLIGSVLLLSYTVCPPVDPPTGWQGELYCRVWATKMFFWGMMLSSTFNLVAITLERYIAVVWPIVYRTHGSVKIDKLVITIVWLSGSVYNGLYKIPTTIVGEDGSCLVYGNYKPPGAKTIVGLLNFILQFLLPLLGFSYCYGHIIYRLRGTRRVYPLSSSDSTGGGTIAGVTETVGLVAKRWRSRTTWRSLDKVPEEKAGGQRAGAEEQSTRTSEAWGQDMRTSKAEAREQSMRTSEAGEQSMRTSGAGEQRMRTSEVGEQSMRTSGAGEQSMRTSESREQSMRTSESREQNMRTSDAEAGGQGAVTVVMDSPNAIRDGGLTPKSSKGIILQAASLDPGTSQHRLTDVSLERGMITSHLTRRSVSDTETLQQEASNQIRGTDNNRNESGSPTSTNERRKSSIWSKRGSQLQEETLHFTSRGVGNYRLHARKKIIRLLIVIATVFVCCWTCNQLYFLLLNLGYPLNFSNSFYHLTTALVDMNLCINPIVYIIFSTEIQNAAKKTFLFKRKR